MTHVNQGANQGTYWTFTIIAILTVGILGYILGYWVKSNENPSPSIVDTQSNVAGDLFDQVISDSKTLEVIEVNENTDANAEIDAEVDSVHAYTGYVRSLTDQEIILENPDETINSLTKLTFTVEAGTQFFATQEVLVNNQIEYQVTDLTLADIHEGDIVTAYTREDILTADVRFATGIEMIAPAPETIDQKY